MATTTLSVVLALAALVFVTGEPYKVTVGATVVSSGALVEIGSAYHIQPTITITNNDGTGAIDRSGFWSLNSVSLLTATEGNAASIPGASAISTSDALYDGYSIADTSGLSATFPPVTASPVSRSCTVAVLIKPTSASVTQAFLSSECATLSADNTGAIVATFPGAVTVQSSVPLLVGVWHYIAASYTAGTATVIVNGVTDTASTTVTYTAWTNPSPVKIGTDGTSYLRGKITCVQIFESALTYAVLSGYKCAQKFDITVTLAPTVEYTVTTQPATGVSSTTATLEYYPVGYNNRTALVTLTSSDDLAFVTGSNFTFQLYAQFDPPTVLTHTPAEGTVLQPRRTKLVFTHAGTHACIVQGEHNVPLPRWCNRTACGDDFAQLYNAASPPLLGKDKSVTHILPCGYSGPGRVTTLQYQFEFLDVCTSCVYESDMPDGTQQIYRCYDSAARRSWTRRFMRSAVPGPSSGCP